MGYLSSVSDYSKLIEPKEGSWETLIYSQLVRSPGNHLDLQIQGGCPGNLQSVAGSERHR